jgi:uncharacterized membrane protein YedE/YeeE
MSNFISLFTGLIFGVGLALSGMTDPKNVLNFLDVTGAWNPSLLFVLGGAVTVSAAGYFFIRKLSKPIFEEHFMLTDAKNIDRPLVVGSAFFGIGWGVSGYCPGPAIALLASPNWELLAFLPAMLLGFALHHFLFSKPTTAIEAATVENKVDNQEETDQAICG